MDCPFFLPWNNRIAVFAPFKTFTSPCEKQKKILWKLEKFRWRNLLLQNTLDPLSFFDTYQLKIYLCNPGMPWKEVPPGCGTKLWQLCCAALSLRSPPQPLGQSHHSLHWGEGSCGLGGQQGPKSLTLFPIFSFSEPLLQTPPGLHGPGFAPSYSSPPGYPLSGDRTQLVLAFERFSGILSGLVSSVSDTAYSAQGANWGSLSTTQRGDLSTR